MKKLMMLAAASLFAFSTASQAADCAAQAVSKDGKPLAGAAKTAFMKKCEADAGGAAAAGAAAGGSGCESKAVSKDGKPLAGAAKTAFIKKCEADAGGAAAPADMSQQDKMKKCNADATGKKGDERKAFMKQCLSN